MENRAKYEEIKRLLYSGEIYSVEVEYDDDTSIELWAWLGVNKDICFDGISLSLCINKTV